MGSLKSAKIETGQKTALAHPKLTLLDNVGLGKEQVKPPGSRFEVVVQRTITITYKVRNFFVILIELLLIFLRLYVISCGICKQTLNLLLCFG